MSRSAAATSGVVAGGREEPQNIRVRLPTGFAVVKSSFQGLDQGSTTK
jgi:hypothetical protein